MKRLLLGMLFTFLAFQIHAQVSKAFEPVFEKHFTLQKKGMMVLGSWGLGNTMVGGIGILTTNDQESRYFHQMNLGWGVINAGIAALGYRHANSKLRGEMEAPELLKDHIALRNTLLLNAGLDLAYVTAGAYLIERGKSSHGNRERLKGFGKSLILQGAFLFIFDTSMAFHFKGQENQMIQMIVNDQGMGLSINF